MGTILIVMWIIIEILIVLLLLLIVFHFLGVAYSFLSNRLRIIPKSYYFSRMVGKARRIESKKNKEKRESFKKIKRNRRKYESLIFNICKTFSRDCGFKIIDKRYDFKNSLLRVFMKKNDLLEVMLRGDLKSEELVLHILPGKILKKDFLDKKILNGKTAIFKLKDFSKKRFSSIIKECLNEIS